MQRVRIHTCAGVRAFCGWARPKPRASQCHVKPQLQLGPRWRHGHNERLGKADPLIASRLTTATDSRADPSFATVVASGSAMRHPTPQCVADSTPFLWIDQPLMTSPGPAALVESKSQHQVANSLQRDPLIIKPNSEKKTPSPIAASMGPSSSSRLA